MFNVKKRTMGNMKIVGRIIMLLGIITGVFGGEGADLNAQETSNHFRPIWFGENGTGHMNFYVIGAEIDGQPLAVGDEIAICSGDVCVGSQKLKMPISENNVESFASIILSMDDGTKNGFVSGDTALFVIWDASEQKEYEVMSVVYRDDLATWRTDGRFESGASSFVTIKAQSVFEQEIVLKAGWNLISSRLVPDEAGMDQVFKALIDAGYLVKVKDKTGNTLENWGEFGGWKNQIGDFDSREGYKVCVTEDCVLKMSGYPVSLPLEMPLEEGWNTIAYPYSETVNGMNIMNSLIERGVLLKVQDEKGNAIEDWGDGNGWVNDIGVFEPGKAYEVKVSEDAMLTIGGSYLKSQRMSTIELQPVHFIVEYEGNGLEHMNVNIVSFAGLGLEKGDEIAVFDGALCVGVVKLTADAIEDGRVSVKASKAAQGSEDGFVSGNGITIKIWRERKDIEMVMVPELVEGSLVFNENESVFVKLLTATALNKASKSMDVRVYPNPASDYFKVSFDGRFTAGAEVRVMDLSGKLLDQRMVKNAEEVFNVSNYPSGVYLVSVNDGNEKKIHKLSIR